MNKGASARAAKGCHQESGGKELVRDHCNHYFWAGLVHYFHSTLYSTVAGGMRWRRVDEFCCFLLGNKRPYFHFYIKLYLFDTVLLCSLRH